LENLALEGLRILYVSSKFLFYLQAFDVEMHDTLVLQTASWQKEEVLEKVCDALIQKNSDYDTIVDFLMEAADGEECTLGIESIEKLTGKQLAASILNDILYLDNPIVISAGPPEEF